MEDLLFSLNVTVPIFMLMVVGYFLKQIKAIDEGFANKLNNFVFKVALPCLLFADLATVDFAEAWNFKFVMFCFGVTFVSILFVIIISMFIKEKSQRGEFIQASYRSSAALLGLAFIQNIYGSTGLGPLMIVASVPLYNICAVTVLTLFAPGRDESEGMSKQIKRTLLGIAKNPIIDGIAVGLLWSALGFPLPQIIHKTVSNIGSCATPLGLISMGALFDMKKALKVGPVALAATFMKLMGFGIVFVPLAIRMGFVEQELIAILVMLCSATTVSCFVMARNMKYEGTLTSAVVMLSTLLSAFTLTGWLYILKGIAVI
ncbi:MAG: AEC family transporter [Lachnospiraceae bacterium]|nr:AEC family transporter [Lachnospiraceae bacterium]